MTIHRNPRPSADVTSICLIGAALLGALFFEKDAKVALYYLLTGGVLLTWREIKSLSARDWKLELQHWLEVDGGATSLELDLANINGGTKSFYEL